MQAYCLSAYALLTDWLLPMADLLMIVAASCEEDVAILVEDANFWQVESG
jgi:hypothetical protein